ncbi:MAG TPA: TonB-dependent receptor, partial [Thermoanaerobaculia bacterium]|nr:TonB-dependent receptor [Thermoanaerobaculia bacterium]
MLCPIAASAQLQTGDLYGTVRDEQNAPLPGVNLTLTGVGGPKTTQSDSSGRFRFLALFPGEYTLKAELDGFSTVEQTGIGVRVGGKLEVELTLTGAIEETITVTSEATLINPRELNQGPVLSAQELDKIPTARDPWSLLRQAPGVITDRINVGGNESGQQSDFYAGGATTSDNTFAVDGVILTDMAAVGASATYYDFGAYEEVQLTTASTDVTIQTAGVTVNQVTKRGTNTWKGDGRFLRTEGDWQADTTEVNGNKIDSVEEYGANLGGPLMRDHLWIWASYGESDIGNLAQGGQLDRTQLEDFNSKLNFQTTNNSGVAHFWTNDKVKTGRNAGPLFAPEATWDQTTPSDIWKLEDTHVFGSNFYLTGLYSIDDGAFTLAPQGGLNADVLLDENGVWQNSFWDFRQHGEIEQYKLEGNAFFDTGGWGHELKFGAGYREQVNDSISLLPGTGRAVLTCEGYGCGPTDEDGNFLDNVELVEWSRHNVAVTTEYDSAWIQDTLAHDRLTITGGLRYDKQTGHNRAHSDPGSTDVPSGLFPAINFAGDDADDLDWESIVPRLGISYALGEERRTLLRGTFSQYAAQLGQWVATRTDPLAPYSYVYYYFTDANRNLRLDPNELGSLSYYYLYNVNYFDPTSSPNENDPDLDPYMTDEVSLGLTHAFPNNVGVSATLIYRNTTDLLEQRTLVFDESGTRRVATREDYEISRTREGILPDGRSVTVDQWDLRDGLTPTGGTLLVNGDREVEYFGVTFGFQRPLANQWSLRGNVTYNDNELKIGDEFERFDNPMDQVFTDPGGYTGYGDDNDIFTQRSAYSVKGGVVLNSAWSFNVNGIYQVAPDMPWG